MATKILHPLVKRTVMWSLLLPLVGTVIFCMIPVLGWFAIISIVVAPIKVLLFIYVTVHVPSLITASFFLLIATKANAWALAFSTCLVAAVACAMWNYGLRWYSGSVDFQTLGIIKLSSGIAAVAGASLLLSLKFDEHVRQLRAFARLKYEG